MGKTGVIIQARMQSTRLPGKVLLPFYNNRTILDIIIETINSLELPIILAIPDDNDNDILENKFYGVSIFRGSNFNVLERFINAAKRYNLSYIVRVCADNPFLDRALLLGLLDEIKGPIDYISYKINGIPSIKSHLGFFAEVVSLDALIKVLKSTSEVKYLEHVTNFIYENDGLFNIKWVETKDCFDIDDNIRLTIDTSEDFIIAQEIFKINYPEINSNKVLSYLKDKKEIKSLMHQQIYKNTK
jgi:spore coat polysaccharide biosynthesis protein SpsF